MGRKSNTEEFIEKAKLVHGDRYDYSLVEYRGAHEKITVICKKHGEFQQKGYHHLCGQNCSKCMGQNKTTNEFIEEANYIHKNKYNYSLVEYKKAHSIIKIICPVHGIYTQTPSNHLNGAGCLKCAGNYMDSKYFIEKAKLVHGDKYDYSLVDYKRSKQNVKIVCSIHGEFKQLPNNHLNGAGCGKCDNKNKTTDEFIKQAKLIHGDKYDYSLVDYKLSKEKIKIICPIHGEFKQIPNGHLIGSGCAKCDNKNKTTDEFINQAKMMHGEKYDYSLVDYVRSIKKIKIICPAHGIFLQTPSDHLSGYGCKYCYESKGEKKIIEYLVNNNINYVREKAFTGCRNKLPLHFDFYLIELNSLIEYDGEQHFKANKYFGGETAFRKSQVNDEIKNKFVIDNNINLLRIRFDQIKEINDILDKNIKQWTQ